MNKQDTKKPYTIRPCSCRDYGKVIKFLIERDVKPSTNDKGELLIVAELSDVERAEIDKIDPDEIIDIKETSSEDPQSESI